MLQPKNKKPEQPNIWQAPDWAFEAYELSADDTDPKQRYDAVVTALDSAIGRVLDALDGAGVADNTFVFFMSDNGAFRLNRKGLDIGVNDPLRHGGVTCWEGGLRVAAMARWPGRIQAGSVISQPFWSPDVLIACAKLAGAKLPSNIVFDGKDPLPMLTEDAPSPHESLLFIFRTHAAFRKGDWKSFEKHQIIRGSYLILQMTQKNLAIWRAIIPIESVNLRPPSTCA